MTARKSTTHVEITIVAGVEARPGWQLLVGGHDWSWAFVVHRDVPGFPTYRAGNDGSIWTSRVMKGRGRLCDTWRRVAPSRSASGHLHVRLWLDRKQCHFGVHTLILATFVSPRPGRRFEACHFPERDPANNRLSNLRWDTIEANKADMDFHGTSFKGERNCKAKLTEAIVREIRAIPSVSCAKMRELAARYQVDESTIRAVIDGRTWRHLYS